MTKVIQGDCLEKLNLDVFRREGTKSEICLTFLDPPFNQGKDYEHFRLRTDKPWMFHWYRANLEALVPALCFGDTR